MNLLLGKLACWWTRKHKRGVRLLPTEPPHVPGAQSDIRFRCPRCSATWTRQARKVKP